MRTLFKHVVRVFLTHKVLTFMLGMVLLLSSFVYTFISVGIGTVETASESYFETHAQETMAISMRASLSDRDKASVKDGCPVEEAGTLERLSTLSFECFGAVVDSRLNRIQEVTPAMEYEARYYKDLMIEGDHRVRLMMMHERVNIPRIEAGQMPGDGQIALSRAYMEANGIEINDSITVSGLSMEVSGSVLFPDYTLAVFDEPLMFNTRMQSPALVNASTFTAFDTHTGVHIGASGDTAALAKTELDDAALTFVDSTVLTENVMRSGAVYAEIQGSQMMALAVAFFTAATGIGVAGAFVGRMIERSKKPLGVLIALGMPKHSIIIAHLVFLSVASFGFVATGYGLGYWLSPSIRDLFLSFYMLPKAEVTFSLSIFVIAVGIPLLVLNLMSWWMLKRLFKETPDALMKDSVKGPGMLVRPKLKQLLKLPFPLRMQIAFLSRHAGKTLLYLFVLLTVFYMAFVTIGMTDAFGKTLPAYYASTEIKSIARCKPLEACLAGEGTTKVFETSDQVGGKASHLIGLESGNPIHPLKDQKGNALDEALKEGIVLSKSHQLLSGLEVGDTVTLAYNEVQLELNVKGVADVYAGNKVFVERSVLAALVANDHEAYNTLYADHVLDEDAYLEVYEVDAILDQVESIDGLMQTFVNSVVGLSLALGGLVIYLITRLSADDHAYTISMLKVIGYNNKQIAFYLLGGYWVLSVVAFLLAIIPALLTHHLMTQWLAESFNMVIPLAIPWGYVFIIMVIYGMIYAIGIQSAKKMVERLPLSEALKRTQV